MDCQSPHDIGRARLWMRRLWPSLLLACLVAPALALADFSPAITLSVASQDGLFPQVAVASDGDAVVVWQRFDGANQRIQARARAADGTLSAVQNLSPAGQDASDPHVGVDASGDAVVVWQRFDGMVQRVQTRARSAAGTLSPVQNLSGAPGGSAVDARLGVDSSGDAVFVWRRADGAIVARARSAAGTLSATQSLCCVAGEDAAFPQVAVDPGGDAVFAWRRFNSIQIRTRSAAGTLTAVQHVSSTRYPADNPQLDVDSSGNAVFVWQAVVGTDARIQASARSATGAVSGVQTLSAPGQNGELPQVGADASGNAVFVWQRFDGTSERIQARSRSAAGTLSAVQTLSAPGQNAELPQVAVDASGNAVFVWQRFDDTNERIQARSRSGAGTLSGPEYLSPAMQNAGQPAVSVDPDGGLDPNAADAAAVWQRFDSANFRIQAAAQIAP
jgi:hypothetical protein